MSQEVADMHFEMRSASRGFHVYRSIPKPRIEENLKMKPEYATIHDPLAIAITASLQETLTEYRCGGSRSKGDLHILPILFKLWRFTKGE